MTVWELTAVLAAACAAAASGVYALCTRRIMSRLEQMLEDAIHGDYRETRYDESRLSRLEAKLAEFLSAGSLSRERIEADRGRLTETIGDISHQTKTPIANMVLYTQLLQEQALSPEAQALAAEIGTQGEKLAHLIRSLVKTSRLEAGVIALSPALNDVEPLLADLEQSYGNAAKSKRITLTVDAGEGLTARFDPKWTAEALGNLVDNAIKYTPAGGRVSVSCRNYELFCRIDVADTGPGIREEEQAAVFRRFYRGTSVQNAEGVGIGLDLARQIISGQGGYIKLQSAPGQGSMFSVFLPTGG